MRKRLKKHTGSAGGVCAGDVGALVGDLQALARLSEVFYAAEFLAGLKLKVPKCKLVPVHHAFSEELRSQVAAALAGLAPRWGGIPIVGSA
eukprot:3760319-Pyramimonas_sp.AAC.1